ncbi:MAG: hypothetical protein GY821_13065 [Gammaproteobacteria bacterium]|nr:hypothetical protein [Gammaproteobacteria bacterium]
MPLSDTKRLKKLAKKKKKRTVVKKIQQKIAQRPLLMQPIQGCGIAHTLYIGDQDAGMGELVIARGDELNVKAAIFLIDAWCLGIKDCFTHNIETYKITEKFNQSDRRLQRVAPSLAKAYLTQVVQYAKQLGFQPSGEFNKCWQLFHDVPVSTDAPTFTFGKDGKPRYMAGPHDSESFQHKVIETLEKSVGSGNYDFIMTMQP